jgi:hypothetical protein
MEASARMGWVKLHRKLLDHPRFTDGDWLKVWTTCLVLATHRPFKVIFEGKPKTLEPGQFITSRVSLAKATGVQESKVERILLSLKSEQQIEQLSTPRNRIISIKNWEKYQSTEQQNERQLNSNRTTSEHKQELEEGKEVFRLRFEAFRIAYPGRKRGTEVEFTHFKTKYPDRWRAILPNLLPAAIAYAGQCEKEGTELRYRKHLKTWINGECWTTERPEESTPVLAALPPEDDYIPDSLLEDSNG